VVRIIFAAFMLTLITCGYAKANDLAQTCPPITMSEFGRRANRFTGTEFDQSISVLFFSDLAVAVQMAPGDQVCENRNPETLERYAEYIFISSANWTLQFFVWNASIEEAKKTAERFFSTEDFDVELVLHRIAPGRSVVLVVTTAKK